MVPLCCFSAVISLVKDVLVIIYLQFICKIILIFLNGIKTLKSHGSEKHLKDLYFLYFAVAFNIGNS